VAPLVELCCTPASPGAPVVQGPAAGPTLLYIVPTRALVNDLAARLRGPLDTLNLRLAVRTGDRIGAIPVREGASMPRDVVTEIASVLPVVSIESADGSPTVSTGNADFQPAPVGANISASIGFFAANVCRQDAGAPSRHDADQLDTGAPSEYDDSALSGGNAPFRPAVAVQQIFSLLKASPTGAVRRAELSVLFTGLLDAGDIDVILVELRRRDYLAGGRPGDLTAGPRLNDLFDQQGRKNCPLSVYSNIQGAAVRPIEVRDQHTGAVVATVDAEWLDHPVLTLEGRPVTVEWQDGEALWVSADRSGDTTRRMTFRSRGQLLSYDLARLLPAALGLPHSAAPLVPASHGWLCYHWLGDVYGQALFDLLRYQIYASQTKNMGLCVELGDEPRALPSWTEDVVVRYCADNYREIEPMLALGPLQSLLPTRLRQRAVIAQFDVPRFLAAIDALRPIRAPEQGTDALLTLLDM
jgi:hypothetical protein